MIILKGNTEMFIKLSHVNKKYKLNNYNKNYSIRPGLTLN